MAWVGGRLRCDMRPACRNIISAPTHGTALRIANEQGWWRGNRGGWRVDYCTDHHPDRQPGHRPDQTRRTRP